jgi:hypothetical protein
MLIYHGTTADRMADILANGLRPRGKTASQWAEYPSRTDCVYLTTAYPFFFAMAGPTTAGKRFVVEIDTDKLDQSLFLPDEDFIAQSLFHSTGNTRSQDDIHNEIRYKLEKFEAQDLGDSYIVTDIPGAIQAVQPAWQLSLKFLTTCCYRGVVPPSAFTRYCLFDYKQRPLVSALAYNEGPHLNGRRNGAHEHSRNLTAWFFGYRRKLPRFKPEHFAADLRDDGDGELGRYLLNPPWAKEDGWLAGIETVSLT